MTTTPLYTVQEMSFPWKLIQETALFLWKDWPKDMIVNALDSTGNCSLSGICPYCRRDSVFTPVGGRYTEAIAGGLTRLAMVMQCQGCRGLIMALVNYIPNQFNSYTYETHYPTGMPNEGLHESIPQDVAEDFREAFRCQAVKAYRACVVMCRRALQTSVLSLNAQGRTLVEQIEDLMAKGIITVSLKNFAHEIRLTGNAGAHSDGLQEIKETDAGDIMEFTREYLDHVYVMPAKLKARRPQTISNP